MLQIFLAILLALASSHGKSKAVHNNGGQVTVMDDTGGDTGHIPPDPPKP